MPKRDTSESDSESEGTSCSRSESEEPETVGNGKGVSEYEEQRLRRIAENRARLEALGLPQMASSLRRSPRIKKKGKEKVENDDEEYRPEDEGEGEPGSSSSGEEEGHDFDVKNASGSRKRKVKNKGLKTKGRVSGKKNDGKSKYIDDDDEALRQAIVLSLQDSAEAPYCSEMNVGNISKAKKEGNIHIQEDKGRKKNKNLAIVLSLQDSAEAPYCSEKNVGNISKAKKKGNIHIQEDKGRKKNKNSFASRLQMTEDELIVHFFQLDETGKGTVSIRDLERAALAHDFVWTDKELVDMIRCFDGDGDGKLSLDDFRKIVVRCNMLKGSENS